jgi:hypothetical protein
VAVETNGAARDLGKRRDEAAPVFALRGENLPAAFGDAVAAAAALARLSTQRKVGAFGIGHTISGQGRVHHI